MAASPPWEVLRLCVTAYISVYLNLPTLPSLYSVILEAVLVSANPALSAMPFIFHSMTLMAWDVPAPSYQFPHISSRKIPLLWQPSAQKVP